MKRALAVFGILVVVAVVAFGGLMVHRLQDRVNQVQTSQRATAAAVERDSVAARRATDAMAGDAEAFSKLQAEVAGIEHAGLPSPTQSASQDQLDTLQNDVSDLCQALIDASALDFGYVCPSHALLSVSR